MLRILCLTVLTTAVAATVVALVPARASAAEAGDAARRAEKRAAEAESPEWARRLLQDAATAWRHAGQPLEEARVLQQLLEILPLFDPERPEVVDRLVDLHIRSLWQPSRAIDLLEVERSLHGRDGQYDVLTLRLADLHFNIGEEAEAERLYNDAFFHGADTEVKQIITERQQLMFERYWKPPSLPMNLEMASSLSLFESRLRNGDAGSALGDLAAALRQHGRSIVSASPGLGQSAREAAARVLRELPERKAERLQESVELEVAALVSDGNAEDLAAYLFGHPLPGIERPLLAALGDRHAHWGRDALARACYERALSAAGADPPEDVLRQRVDALPLPGPGEDSGTAPAPLNVMVAREVALERAPEMIRILQSGRHMTHRHNYPTLFPGYVPYQFSGDSDAVYLQADSILYSLDPSTGRFHWKRRPPDGSGIGPLLRLLPGQGLARCPQIFRPAVGEEAVYARFAWRDVASDRHTSVVEAVRKDTGSLLWSSRGQPELAGLDFITDPAVADGVVVAAAWKPGVVPDYYLVGFEAATGEVLWRTQLFAGMSLPHLHAGHYVGTVLSAAPPVIRDGVAYYCSGAGVMAAVDSLDGSVLWLQDYPQVRTGGPDQWGGEFLANRVAGPLLLFAGRLWVSPPDSRSLFAVDPETGEREQAYTHLDYNTLVGEANGLLILQHWRQLVGLDPETREVVWEWTLDAPLPVGVATLSPRGILWASRGTLFVIDPKDGAERERLLLDPARPAGNFLDLGDRLVGGFHATVAILGEPKALEDPGGAPLGETTVTTTVSDQRGGIAEWVLPAWQRGHVILSRKAPGHLVMVGPDTVQFRRRDRVPTLYWESSMRGYPVRVSFSDRWVVLWHPGWMQVLDGETGAETAFLRDPDPGGDAYAGVVVEATQLYWYDTARVRAVDPRTGVIAWEETREKAILYGVTAREGRVALHYLNRASEGAPDFVRVLDGATGEVVYEKRFDEPEARYLRPVVPEGNPANEGVEFLLVGERQLWRWNEALTACEVWMELPEPAERIEQSGQYLLLTDGDGHTRKAIQVADKRVADLPEGNLYAVRDGVFYYKRGNRVHAYDMAAEEELWISGRYDFVIRGLSVSGSRLLVAMGRGDGWQFPHEGRVVALDRDSGEEAEVVEIASGRLDAIHTDMAGLLLSGRDAVYAFRAPVEPTDDDSVESITTTPDAAGARRTAYGLNHRLELRHADAAAAVELDSHLFDWQDAPWNTMTPATHWQPDVVRVEAARPEPAAEPASASFAVSRNAEGLLVAVEVRDDRHDTSPHVPLWQGDSIRMDFQPPEPRAMPAMLTVALVDGVPVAEWGDPARPQRVMTAGEHWAPEVRDLVGSGEVPWLREWQREANEGGNTWELPAAVFRDEERGRTLYEFLVPVAQFPDLDNGWRLWVNDADGNGRRGALLWGGPLLGEDFFTPGAAGWAEVSP